MEHASDAVDQDGLQVQQSAKSAEGSPARHEVTSERDEDMPTETVCTICLGPLQNKSFTDSCFHMFCFVCLLEWSKVKAVCPLCKQPFSSIIHSVRSLEDYDRHYIQQPTDGQQESGAESRFRYRTTLTADRWLRHLQREHNRQLQLLSTESDSGESEGVAMRRRVYESGRRTQLSTNGRVRDVSPAFLASHPACVHRLAPWLQRELSALLTPSTADRRRFVLELVLELVTHFAIDSADFAEHVRPFIGRHTSHFIYELRLFATSPYDLVGYDRRVRYNEDVDGPRTVISDEEEDAAESSDGSDLIVMPQNSEPAEVVNVLASPEPATSAEAPVVLSPTFSPPESPPVSPALPVSESPTVMVKNECYTSPGSDVEVIGYEKPWAERSPEYVYLGSPTAAEQREEKLQIKRKAAALAAMARGWSSSSESDDSKGSRRHKDRKHRRHEKRRHDHDERRDRSEREVHSSTRDDRVKSSRHRHREERSVSRHSEFDDRYRRHKRDDTSRSSSRHHDFSKHSRSSRQEDDRRYRDDRHTSLRYDYDQDQWSRSSRRHRQRDDSPTTSRHRANREDRSSASRHRPVPEKELVSKSHGSSSAPVNPWSLGSLLSKKNTSSVEDDTTTAHAEENSSAQVGGSGRSNSEAGQRSVHKKHQHRERTENGGDDMRTQYKKNSSGHKKSRTLVVDSASSGAD